MSTRTSLRPQPVVPSAQASPTGSSMTTSITSAPTVLQSLSMVNYSIVWSNGATPIGTISVEASTDCTVDPAGGVSGGTWNPLPLDLNGVTVTTIPLTGNSGKGMIDIDGLAAFATRLVYTRSSGTGTLAVVVNGKVA